MKCLLILLLASYAFARPNKYFPNNENYVNAEYNHVDKQNIPDNTYGKAIQNLFKILMNPGKRCANLGGDDCANGYLPDAGYDNDYLGSGNTPGKRCANLGGDDCANGYLPDAGYDNDYLGSGNTPGKRCANLGGDDCANGYLPDAGYDNDYLGSGNTPGKRCANLGGDDCANGYLPDAGMDNDYLGSGNTPGKRSILNNNLRKGMRNTKSKHKYQNI